MLVALLLLFTQVTSSPVLAMDEQSRALERCEAIVDLQSSLALARQHERAGAPEKAYAVLWKLLDVTRATGVPIEVTKALRDLRANYPWTPVQRPTPEAGSPRPIAIPGAQWGYYAVLNADPRLSIVEVRASVTDLLLSSFPTKSFWKHPHGGMPWTGVSSWGGPSWGSTSAIALPSSQTFDHEKVSISNDRYNTPYPVLNGRALLAATRKTPNNRHLSVQDATGRDLADLHQIPQENHLLLAQSDGGAYLAWITRGEPETTLELRRAHDLSVRYRIGLARDAEYSHLYVSASGRTVVVVRKVGNGSQKLSIVDVYGPNGEKLYEIPGFADHSLDLSPDGSQLAMLKEDGCLREIKTKTIWILNLLTGKYQQLQFDYPWYINTLQTSFSWDSKHLAFHLRPEAFKFFSLETGREVFTLDKVAAIDHSPDGTYFLAFRREQNVQAYTYDGTLLAELPTHVDPFWSRTTTSFPGDGNQFWIGTPTDIYDWKVNLTSAPKSVPSPAPARDE